MMNKITTRHTHIFVTHTGIDVRTLQHYEKQQSLSQMDIGQFVHKMANFGSIKTNSDPF